MFGVFVIKFRNVVTMQPTCVDISLPLLRHASKFRFSMAGILRMCSVLRKGVNFVR